MATSAALKISSEAFEDEGAIPSKYTCEGENINPPLKIENMPEGTQTIAVIMEDPDAPNGTFDHWLAWNIPPDIDLEEDRPPGISGKNGAGKAGYYGPCPPSGSHRYYFHVFALDAALDLGSGTDRQGLEAAINKHLLSKGILKGRYEKKWKVK